MSACWCGLPTGRFTNAKIIGTGMERLALADGVCTLTRARNSGDVRATGPPGGHSSQRPRLACPVPAPRTTWVRTAHRRASRRPNVEFLPHGAVIRHYSGKRWEAKPLKRMAHPARFERATSAFGGQRSIQLSYGCSGRNAGAHHRQAGRPRQEVRVSPRARPLPGRCGRPPRAGGPRVRWRR